MLSMPAPHSSHAGASPKPAGMGKITRIPPLLMRNDGHDTRMDPIGDAAQPKLPDSQNQQHSELPQLLLTSCAGFYGEIEVLLKRTDASVIAQCYPNDIDPLQMLSEAKRECDTLLNLHSLDPPLSPTVSRLQLIDSSPSTVEPTLTTSPRHNTITSQGVFGLQEGRGSKRPRETDDLGTGSMSPPNPAIINSAIMLSTSTASAVDIGPARKLPRKNACSICRKPGHYAKTCSTKTADLDMGSTAPPTVVNSDIMISASATSAVPGESDKPQDDEQTRKRVTSCSICRKPGHYAKTCSTKTAGLDMGSMASPAVVNSDIMISASATSAVPGESGEPPDGEQTRKRVTSCGICRKPGHYAKTCSSKTAGLDTRSTAPPTIVNSDMIISASATSAFTAAPVASENGEERQMRSCGICRKPGHYAKTCEQNRRHPDSMV